MRRIKNKTGFSLVELLLAFAIIVIIFAAVVPQFRAIRNSWAGTEASAAIIANGRVLAEHLSRNLSAAKYIVNFSAGSEINDYITFIIDNNGTKTQKRYAVSGGYVVFDSGDGSGDQQLAGPVDKFQISCYDANAVSTTDMNDIRLVKFETVFPNDNALGSDKTFSSEVFIQTNDQAAAVERGDTFEPYSGPAFEYDTSNGQYPALAKIDSTRYLCAYTGSGSDGYAVVLTVNQSTGAITRGTALEYDTSDGRYPALVQIDATHYLCAYYRGGPGNAIVLTVSGTNVTAGARSQFDTSGAYPALTQIDATHYLCAYYRGGYGYAVVLTVSGTTITAGAQYQFDTTTCAYFALSQIDSSRYLCVYYKSGRGNAVVLTVSGTTVTWGAQYQFDTSCAYPDLVKIDSTRYLCAYYRSGPGNAIVLTVSGTNVTAGVRSQFDTSGAYPALSQIDSSRYLCAYYRSGRGNTIVLTVSGTNVTAGARSQFDTSCSWPALAQIDTCNYLCAYAGQGNDGWSVVLQNRVKP